MLPRPGAEIRTLKVSGGKGFAAGSTLLLAPLLLKFMCITEHCQLDLDTSQVLQGAWSNDGG